MLIIGNDPAVPGLAFRAGNGAVEARRTSAGRDFCVASALSFACRAAIVDRDRQLQWQRIGARSHAVSDRVAFEAAD
jgi:hypothetical protein